MSEPEAVATRAERRWPMALAVLVTIGLQVGTPKAGRVTGGWIVPVLELLLLGVLVAVDPGRVDDVSARARRITLALITVMTVGMVTGLSVLIYDILAGRPGLSADNLFGRGGAIWLTNVIAFSLWFWELDRGGPAERAAGSDIPLSFAFPENAMPEFADAGWIPRYPDYLYLSFTNATAFSPTDTLPVKTWAKLAMMLESVVSLLTAIIVIARAINAF
ncbi:MAG TPA: hypothetical protein VLX89_09020 [Actinomycetota bacterium]|nr:hypothetical protein [Actinomycetota bacterium]